jgi:hypothetical protein
MVKQLAISDKRYAVEQLAPALRDAKIPQTQLVREMLGLAKFPSYPYGGLPTGKAIEKQLELNDESAMRIDGWRHSKLAIYSMEDLPEQFQSVNIKFKIFEKARKRVILQNIVLYAGDVYFDFSGYRDILNMGIRAKIISIEEAEAALNTKSVY